MKFHSTVENLGRIPQTFSQLEIKNETMLFSADYEFARKNGDGLTHKFLDFMQLIGWDKSQSIIDSRVHMLMPGWYPAIPGFHHDDVPRTTAQHPGQPNYIAPEYYSEHLLWIVGADISPTHFVIGDVELNLPPRGQIIYEQWDVEIRKLLASNNHPELSWLRIADSHVYRFTWESFHEATAAVKNGWRFFIRATRTWKDRDFTIPDEQRFQRRTDKNQIRRQVQIYMGKEKAGW